MSLLYIYNILAYNQHKGDVSLKNKVLTVDSSQHIRIFISYEQSKND